jgi:uncharacterized protein (DUF362 family)/Pyruvate/2-oxoacid:ferredoxin oxidoreductase delta subunit
LEKVIAGGSDSYDPKRLKEFFEEGFRRIGLDLRGRTVLVKPNLLSARSPERAVTTHPLFLKALIEILKDNSCAVSLGDSPGFEPLPRVLKNGGYAGILSSLDVEIKLFTGKVLKRTAGVSPYREFLFGHDPADYDLVINVPKLKTHAMMGMTLGVKNTFGFIRGLAKGRWHLQAGRNRELFASILVDIHKIVSPGVTILDGVLGMCGDGPSSGDAIACGILALSRSGFALDAFIEQHLCPGVPLPVSSCAAQHGLVSRYEVVDLGLPPPPPSFPMPRSCDTDWNLPRPVKGMLRGLLVKKPRADKRMCRLCGVCAKVCPAGAIRLGESSPHFDYSLCIRCYCCQEMCPHEAIRT